MPEQGISGRLRQDADPIWREIFGYPFVVGLYRGDLPLEKFRFYVLQDYNFLVAMMKNLAILASKAETVSLTREMLELAHLEGTSEFQGYEALLGKLGYTLSDALKVSPAPVNISYSSFLLATSSLKTFWEGLTAILPCFWTYAEIADFHREKLLRNGNALYTEWAAVYLSESYLSLVGRLRGLVDAASAAYERLREVFLTASQYEYDYWDTAYNYGGQGNG